MLGTGPSLWRVDGTTTPPTAVAVTGLPAELLGTPPNDQSFYDCAAALDPGNAARLIVGGAAVASPVDAAAVPSSSWAAAMYRLTVSPGPGPGQFRTDCVCGEGRDPTWIGSEVHADVHAITWTPVAGGAHVWVGCDGGPYRSPSGGDRGSFVARGAGMAVSEPGFVASSPVSPGPVLAGMQDNGPQLRLGEGVWRQALRLGDGGGVAFDPGAPGRFVAQWTQPTWQDDAGTDLSPPFRLN